MRPTQSCLAAILVLGAAAPAHAQSERGYSFRDGIQSSVNRFVEHVMEGAEDLAPQFRAVGRHMWLFGNDIVLEMSAEDRGEGTYLVAPGELLLWREEAGGDNSLYAEFDWETRAEYMRVNTSEGAAYLGVAGAGEVWSREAGEEESEMYFDRHGNTYVFAEDDSGEEFCVRVNLPGMIGDLAGALQINIDNAIEAGVADSMDRLFALLQDIAPGTLLQLFGGYGSDAGSISDEMRAFLEGMQDFLSQYSISRDPETGEFEFPDGVTEEQLREFMDYVESMEEMARAQFEDLGAFPPLIHFAFIFTPTTVRAQLNVDESTVPCRGQDGCTRFVVNSGEDEGYVILFDRYDRLIYLRDTDGDSATYSYKDVTVTIPPCMSAGELMGR